MLEAHNDYLQAAAELGLVGFVILGWLLSRLGAQLWKGFRSIPSNRLPLMAAFVAAAAAFGIHEVFDFGFQITSNALLATIILGLMLRMVPDRSSIHLHVPRCGAACIAGAALLLGVGALVQDKSPYPLRRTEPATPSEAQQLLLAHPAASRSHIGLLDSLGASAPKPIVIDHLAKAVWLDPTDPIIRDQYAQCLLLSNRRSAGREQLIISVSLSPYTDTHSYLTGPLLTSMSLFEQEAVEQGFRRAAASGYGDAMNGLANFYQMQSRFSDEGEVYERAAGQQSSALTRSKYLLNAAQAYIRAKDGQRAERLLRKAIKTVPGDPTPYELLAILVLAPKQDLNAVKMVLAEGARSGADPVRLAIAMAKAAEVAGDTALEEAALSRAIAIEPYSADGELRLGHLYVAQGNYDRAALELRRALEIDPRSPVAWSELARAEAGRYRLLEASRAYEQALKLDPGNRILAQEYKAFSQRSSGGITNQMFDSAVDRPHKD